MKSFIITVNGNEISEVASAVCKKSHDAVGNEIEVKSFFEERNDVLVNNK